MLITGVAGFIASRTTALLLDQGYAIVGIDDLNDYYYVGLKRHRLDSLKKYSKFTFRELSVEDFSGLKALFEEYSFMSVIHLAARAGVRYSMENPHVYISTNVHGTLNVLELMRKHEVKKMVLASTSSLYAGQSLPFTEDLSVNAPISPYAASKKAAESLAYTYHHLYALDISVVRYFTVYGPAGRPDMSVFRFIKWIYEGTPIQLFGDGTQGRDFTYIDDIACGTIAALKPVGYEIINLGGGTKPVNLKAIIAMIENLFDKKASIEEQPFHKADLKQTWANIDKAKRLLNWQPRVTLEEGIKQCADWFLANQEWLPEQV